MNSDVLFENERVVVNTAFFNAGSTQFPIRNIGAIQVIPESPNRKPPLLLLGFSLMAMMGASLSGSGVMGFFVCLPLFAGAIWWLTKQKSTHWINVMTSSGNAKAYGSKDPEEITQIQQAINTAIARLHH